MSSSPPVNRDGEVVLLRPEAGRIDPSPDRADLPAIVARCGPAAAFTWDEFFSATIRNSNTRKAYRTAVNRFCGWCESRRIELTQVTPGLVGEYFDGHAGSIPTKKLHLAAIRSLFDLLVTRHVVILNPALSVRGERYQVVEGKTPEFTVEQVRVLLRSTPTSDVVGLRDRALIAVLVYTAARIGAVCRLRLRDFQHDGTQHCLRFTEKGGKVREIPVRHDLERFLLDYMHASGLSIASADTPLFCSAPGRKLTRSPLLPSDACRMVKRRLKAAGLPTRLSPHSFRVTTITDLLEQGVSLDEVQHLAGHADPRTTRLYDRRQKRVTRNLVERISV